MKLVDNLFQIFDRFSGLSFPVLVDTLDDVAVQIKVLIGF